MTDTEDTTSGSNEGEAASTNKNFLKLIERAGIIPFLGYKLRTS